MTRTAVAETWNGRGAVRLSNGVMEAVMLRGGGHLAELKSTVNGGEGVNCLWAAPWQTADPGDTNAAKLAEEYGGGAAGGFLAGYTGHALCLDVFGMPTEEDAARGVALHGEAAAREWSLDAADGACVGRVELPVAQLVFERSAALAENAAVLFVEERVENYGVAREIHWVQHLSLGPPLVEPECGRVDASLDRAKTWPLGYEGCEMLRSDTEFAWPYAPSVDQGDTFDLRAPFARAGCGFVAAARVDAAREFGFITALNWRLGLALIYGFRREDFPWVAIWEENCARRGAPWSGKAQVRGMEFGTTPMPLGREAIRAMGNLLDTPGSRTIEAGGVLEARYFAAIAAVPKHWRGIRDVTPGHDELTITGPRADERVTVAVAGISDFPREGRKKK
jgi:hypothetical protein